LFHRKLERGRFTHVIMVSSSFGERHGKTLRFAAVTNGKFEWLSHPGSKKALSSGGTVLGDSAITDFEVLDSAP